MKIKIYLISSIFVFIFFPLLLFAQEDITITTYYPSPFGSYRELSWGDLPSNSRGRLTAEEGASIELGGVDGATAGTPHIDFHNDMTTTNDYDIRLLLDRTNGNINQFHVIGGRTTFRNNRNDNDPTSPAIIRVKEVWYCAQYNNN